MDLLYFLFVCTKCKIHYFPVTFRYQLLAVIFVPKIGLRIRGARVTGNASGNVKLIIRYVISFIGSQTNYQLTSIPNLQFSPLGFFGMFDNTHPTINN